MNSAACQVGSLSRQLEDERGKAAQLKRDMENFKKKAKAEQEKAARMVRTHGNLVIPREHLSHLRTIYP